MNRIARIGLALFLIPTWLTIFVLTGSEISYAKPTTIRLKFSCPFIRAEPTAVIANHFMDLVEKKTNKRVKFKRFFSEVLAKHAEHIQLIGSGSVDLGMVVPVYLGRELLLNQLLDFPFYCSNEKAVAQANKLLMEIPETKAIFDEEQKRLNIKILHWNTVGAMEVLSKQKATSLADLKGNKINLWAPPDVEIWGGFGMVAVPIFIADFYESISRGVVDSLYFQASGSFALKLFEQAKSNLSLHQGDASSPIIFNLKSWNKLPADLQKVILEASQETSKWSVGYVEGITAHAHKIFKGAGLHVGEVPKAESEELFHALMKHTSEQFWIGMCTKSGVGEQAEILFKYWKEMAWGR